MQQQLFENHHEETPNDVSTDPLYLFTAHVVPIYTWKSTAEKAPKG